MKKLLFLLLFLPGLTLAQLQLPYSIKIVNPKPVDWYYYKSSGVPYANTGEVTSQVPSAARYKGQTFNVAGAEYWFATGITNGDLAVKISTGPLVQGANTITQNLNFDGAFAVGLGQTTPITSFKVTSTAINEITAAANITPLKIVPNATFTFAQNALEIDKSGGAHFGIKFDATNMAIGRENALVATTSGSGNTVLAMGVSGDQITSGSSNTLVGYSLGHSLTTTSYNTWLGASPGGTANTEGNTVIGASTASNNLSGYSIVIGAFVDPPASANVLNIGNVLYGKNLYATSSSSSTPTTTGSIGIGLTTPTARLHLPAGTTTLGPLKLTSGPVVTTIAGGVQDGLFDYDGTHLSFIIGSTRYQIDQQAGGGTPGGSTTQVQYNNAGAFGGASGLTYNSGTSVLTFSQIPILSAGLGNATASTQAGGTNNTTLATTAFVTSAISTASQPFLDNTALIKDNADGSKQWRIEASSITTATTRVWTVPDFDGTFARASGTNTFTGVQTFSSLPTIPLTPVSDGDATSKKYIDDLTLPIPLTIDNGGTGQTLVDPAAHTLMGWDNTGNIIRFMTIGNSLTYTQATNTLNLGNTSGTPLTTATTVYAGSGVGITYLIYPGAISGTSFSSFSWTANGLAIESGVTSASKPLFVSKDDATTNAIYYAESINKLTSGTAAIGLGAGTEFGIENASGTRVVMGSIAVVSTNVTAGTEAGDLVFNTLNGTVNEKFRIESGGSVSMVAKTAATSATTGTMTTTLTNLTAITITPTGDCTFNASGGFSGQSCSFVVTTSGTTSWNLTFGTNYKSTGVLATGTVTAKVFTVSFVYNGTNWNETARTTAM